RHMRASLYIRIFLAALTTFLTSPLSFSVYSSAAHRDLHSFPTRRSSDLCCYRQARCSAWLPPCAPSPAIPSPISSSDRSISPSTDRKSTRLNSSHRTISYAVFCLKKKKKYLQQ